MSYKNKVIEDMIELLYDATIPMGNDYIVKYSHNTITIRNKFADFRSQYDNRGFFMNSQQRAFCKKFDKQIRKLIWHWFNGINDDGIYNAYIKAPGNQLVIVYGNELPWSQKR